MRELRNNRFSRFALRRGNSTSVYMSVYSVWCLSVVILLCIVTHSPQPMYGFSNHFPRCGRYERSFDIEIVIVLILSWKADNSLTVCRIVCRPRLS